MSNFLVCLTAFSIHFVAIINFIREAATGGVFIEKGALKKFAKFTGKHLCQSLSPNEVTGRGLQLY